MSALDTKAATFAVTTAMSVNYDIDRTRERASQLEIMHVGVFSATVPTYPIGSVTSRQTQASNQVASAPSHSVRGNPRHLSFASCSLHARANAPARDAVGMRLSAAVQSGPR